MKFVKSRDEHNVKQYVYRRHFQCTTEGTIELDYQLPLGLLCCQFLQVISHYFVNFTCIELFPIIETLWNLILIQFLISRIALPLRVMFRNQKKF